ncbi:MAG: DUF1553 domain-containing protein [Candidatus Hydrogenedens sp.]|nr:DUF1553 domain-containing protein [Candidatus Hydrogenedens sp.]
MVSGRILLFVTPALLSLSAAAEGVDFMRDVHPILAEHCYQCHGGGKSKGGLKLDSREAVLEGGSDGAVVVLGDSAGSRLMQLISAADPADRMPPKGPGLNANEIAVMAAWINEGLVWDDAVPALPSYDAPLALRDVALPGDGANVVDTYLKPYMESHNAATPESVSDRAFLRRATLDAIGLLPTEAELDAFLMDAAPDKRDKAVEALLARNEDYAGHWMTFWNDLLRNDYQGTGYIDGGREQISRWLHETLLENKPYDQMTRELIDPRPSSQGFIKGIVWRGDNATVQLPSMQAARNVSQVFLGVNMKCASCHDSFVNHWKLEDSFGLANVFSETPMEMVRCDTPTGEAAPYKFLWPELGDIDASLSPRDRAKRVAELVTTPENGFFARTIVNRIWAKFFGRGLVEPLDAIELEPWNTDLLDALAQDFVDHGYDLKHLMATLMQSEAYGWKSAVYSPESDAPYVFAGPAVRRLSAEQFYDALAQLTGAWQQNPGYLFPGEEPVEKDGPPQLKGPVRAWRVTSDPLSRALGRTTREQVTSARVTDATTLQALELTNGDTLASYLNRAAESLTAQAEAGPNTLVKDLFLAALQRQPTPEEREAALELLQDPISKEGAEDLLWVIAMLPEFQLVF